MLSNLKASLRRSIGKQLAMLGCSVVAVSAMMASSVQADVTIRLASDTAGLPHPAAIAMERLSFAAACSPKSSLTESRGDAAAANVVATGDGAIAIAPVPFPRSDSTDTAQENVAAMTRRNP